MEAKDLALILLVPSLIIGILFFGPKITGFVVFDDENILGHYSLNPSFIIEKGYNIDHYKEMRLRLKTAIEECKPDIDIKRCIDLKLPQWRCQDNDLGKSVLAELKDKLNECSEVDGVCRFNLDERIGLDEKFSFRISKDSRRSRISLGDYYDTLDFENILYTGYNDKDISQDSLEFIEIRTEYSDGIPSSKFVSGNVELSSKAVYIKDGLKFIDFLEENLFLDEQANEITQIPRRNGMKFCVKYDELEYKFAILFPSPPPLPVEGLRAQKAQGSNVTIYWPSIKGAAKYNVYYSKKEFLMTKTEDIRNDPEISKMWVDSKIFHQVQSIENLDNNKLYKNEDNYAVMLEAEDNIPFYYAVTALDFEGKELDNDKSNSGNTYILSMGRNYMMFKTRADSSQTTNSNQ